MQLILIKYISFHFKLEYSFTLLEVCIYIRQCYVCHACGINLKYQITLEYFSGQTKLVIGSENQSILHSNVHNKACNNALSLFIASFH